MVVTIGIHGDSGNCVHFFWLHLITTNIKRIVKRKKKKTINHKWVDVLVFYITRLKSLSSSNHKVQFSQCALQNRLSRMNLYMYRDVYVYDNICSYGWINVWGVYFCFVCNVFVCVDLEPFNFSTNLSNTANLLMYVYCIIYVMHQPLQKEITDKWKHKS